MVSGSAFRESLKFFSNIYDVILVDTPPFSAGADAQTIASSAGGVMLVARKHKTRTSQMSDIAESLEANGTPIVGSVLIEF